MNNNQPINMLAAKESNPKADSVQNSLVSSDRGGQHLSLANIFNSLTSLANSQQQQQVSSNNSGSGHLMQLPTSQQPLTGSSSTSMATIQSVVAAAMMQQQLAAAVAAGGQSQANTPSLAGADSQPFGSLFEPQDVQFGGMSHQQLQIPANMSQHQQQHHQGQQQRINYCTICNKELCNKYFMKTHMLKMHGINLEMEQAGESDDCEKANEGSDGQMANDSNGEQESYSSSKKSPRPSSSGKSKSSATGKSSSSTTSVMNGFAGNSMGGVVCDICNKELCSKYFLKVHKQNTHGIMTDYQDQANQFVYPFGPTNPFMSSATAALPPVSVAPVSAPPELSLASYLLKGGVDISHQSTPPQPKRMSTANGAVTKKMRLSQTQSEGESTIGGGQHSFHNPPFTDPNKELSSVYRLMLVQQQQQHPFAANIAGGPPTAVPMMPAAHQSFLSSLEAAVGVSAASAATNPMSAFMFGAMTGPTGPFGPAAMSPAMIVDNMLRNQHLFNRHKQPQQPGKDSAKGSADTNNITKKSSASTSSTKTSSSDPASNSKYFSHYTEACPMCDRRFKSIKWLKTHMINDHKQEIGAYMQMMLQYLYTSKSQQIAAAIEQQQRLMRQHNQHLDQQPPSHHQHLSGSQLFPNQQPPQQQAPPSYLPVNTSQHQQIMGQQIARHQQPSPDQQQQQQSLNSLLSKCLNYANFQPTTTVANCTNKNGSSTQALHHQHQAPFTSSDVVRQSNDRSPVNYHLASGVSDFVIDARCKTESLSGGESENQMDNNNQLDLSFDFSQLSKSPRDLSTSFNSALPDDNDESNYTAEADDGVESNDEDAVDSIDHQACSAKGERRSTPQGPLQIKTSGD